LNENALEIKEFPLKPRHIAELIELIESGAINNSIANQKVFPALVEHPELSAKELAEKNNWIQESDTGALEGFIEKAITKFPAKVEAYKAGNKNLLGLFMGEVMKASKGKADPNVTSSLLREKLEQ
jgi:aspartyl-tRNA(Asn)/glutamyl-tRNA(Gln) amidotransferase subunit B